MELGTYIAKRRKSLRLTQEEISQRLRNYKIERTAATVANWETGRQPVPMELIPAIAAALEEESPLVMFELAGILDQIPGGNIAKLLKGASPEDMQRIERMIKAYLEDS